MATSEASPSSGSSTPVAPPGAPVPEGEAPRTFTEAVLGEGVARQGWARRFVALSPTWQVLVASGVWAALVFVPYAGAVGLWDPWETHYGEVARSMVARRDWVYPYYEGGWFFSKPPLTMWLQGLGLLLVDAMRPDGALGRYTEWGMRLPFVLSSVAAVALLSLAVARTAGRRAGLATGFVLSTMPMYFLITRQTVTDTPFVTALTAAMACALIGQADPGTRHRAGWWYGFWVLCGLATLAKGLLGILLPGLVLGLFALLAVVEWRAGAWHAHARWLLEREFRARVRDGLEPWPALWAQFRRMRLGSGLLVFLAVAAPWYATLIAFDQVDDEGKVFWYRFFVHDHLNRLTQGVHTTTPGGTFTYFIEQGGFAIFPWVALLPGALAVLGRARLRGGRPWDAAALLALLWGGAAFSTVAFSATKFHHYILPALPAVAVLVALFVDRLWEEGVGAHALPLLLGLVLFALVGKDLAETPKNFTDLFVYNYERPYPAFLVTAPLTLGDRPLWSGDLWALLLLGAGAWLALDAFTDRRRPPVRRAVAVALLLLGGALLLAVVTRGRVPPSVAAGGALLAAAAWLGVAMRGAPREERAGLGLLGVLVAGAGAGLLLRGLRAGTAPDPMLVGLTQPYALKGVLGFAFFAAGLVLALAAAWRHRTALFGAFWVLAAAFALWFNWSHWPDLSHHWTQRDLFWRYYGLRKEGEPIAAFLMNWHGETFYSRNTVLQFRDGNTANARVARFAAQPGREWVLVEHTRLGLLRSALGGTYQVTPVDADVNNKFVLVRVD